MTSENAKMTTANPGSDNPAAAVDPSSEKSGHSLSSIERAIARSGDGRAPTLRHEWQCPVCPGSIERLVAANSQAPDPQCPVCRRVMRLVGAPVEAFPAAPDECPERIEAFLVSVPTGAVVHRLSYVCGGGLLNPHDPHRWAEPHANPGASAKCAVCGQRVPPEPRLPSITGRDPGDEDDPRDEDGFGAAPARATLAEELNDTTQLGQRMFASAAACEAYEEGLLPGPEDMAAVDRLQARALPLMAEPLEAPRFVGVDVASGPDRTAWWVENFETGEKRPATEAEVLWATEGRQPAAPYRVIGTGGEFPGSGPDASAMVADMKSIEPGPLVWREEQSAVDARTLGAYLANVLRGGTLAGWELEHIEKLCVRVGTISDTPEALGKFNADAAAFVERRRAWLADEHALRQENLRISAKRDELVGRALFGGFSIGAGGVALAWAVVWWVL